MGTKRKKTQGNVRAGSQCSDSWWQGQSDPGPGSCPPVVVVAPGHIMSAAEDDTD